MATLSLVVGSASGCYSGVGASGADTDGGLAESGEGDEGSSESDAGSDGSAGSADTWEPEPLDEDEATSPVARLTRSEYVNTVAAAFGTAPVDVAALPIDGSDGIFVGNGVENLGDYSTYIDVAQSLAQELAPSLGQGCDWHASTTSCVESHLRGPYAALIRDEPSSADLDELATIFSAVDASAEATTDALVASVVLRMLLDDRFLFHLEYGDGSDGPAREVPLSQQERARRIAYYLLDEPPSADLLNAVGDGSASEEIRLMFESPQVREHAWRFVASWLNIPADPAADGGTAPPDDNPPDDNPPDDNPPDDDPPDDKPPVDECNFTSECVEIYGGAATDCVNSGSPNSWCACGDQPCAQEVVPSLDAFHAPRSSRQDVPLDLQRSMHEETRRFVEYVLFDGNVPLTDLFSARYSFIDARLADLYGVPAPATDWERYEFPESALRRGVLTHASFLFSNGRESADLSWIFRGKVVLERLFCSEFPPPPPNAVEMEVESRESTSPCSVCHARMDPVGRMFDMYDGIGALRETTIASSELLAGSDIDGEYAGAVELAAATQNSRALTHCFARMMFREALGRKAVAMDEAAIADVVSALDDSQSFEEATVALLASTSFSTLYLDAADQVCE